MNENLKSDWLLEQYVVWANDFGLEAGVTLNVGGLVVSGTLIGGGQYFKLQSEHFSKGAKEGSASQEIGEILATYIAVYPSSGATQKDNESKPEPVENQAVEPDQGVEEGQSPDSDADRKPGPTFIHLKDARIFSPGVQPLPANMGITWRGKISAVDAFWIGLLKTE